MKAYIKKIELQNFKGCRQETYEFDEQGNVISGMNGVGKTTIATAFFWVFLGKEYNLTSNPNVVPNNVEEASPTVALTLDVDGKEITLEKSQKIRKSKDGKVSTVNSYNINGLEKSQTAFETYFTDLGFDFSRFAYLTNPNAFMGEKSKDMREMLFSMVSEKSDIEIAKSMSNVDEATKLLESYTMAEAEAMQKQSIRKITDVHGKSGELTQAKIEGMEQSKVDIDVAEQELLKNSLQERIAEFDEKIRNGSSALDELRGQDMRLQEEMSVIMQEMNAELHKKHNEFSIEISNLEWKAKNILDKVMKTQDMFAQNAAEIKSFDSKKNEINRQWKENESKVFDETPYQFDESKWLFDESTTVCSLCGQKLPEDKIEQLKAEFENKKENQKKFCEDDLKIRRTVFIRDKEDIKKYLTEQANTIKQREAELKSENERFQKEIAELQEQEEQAEQRKAELEKQLSELPSEADYKKNQEYIKLSEEREKVLAEIEKLNTPDVVDALLYNEKVQLQEELDKCKEVIAKAQRNVEIDEMICSLKSEWKEYEQQRSDCERVLFQLDLISQKKNELLTQEISSYFKYVRWKLFDFQKNGTYINVCVPEIQDDEGIWKIWEDMNGGLRVKAEIDICQSLQRYYNTFLPVFVDEAAEVCSWNVPKSDDTQLFLLKVDEAVEKLKIEKM